MLGVCGRKGFLHVTRAVEKFDVQGAVVGKGRMSTVQCPVVLKCCFKGAGGVFIKIISKLIL